MTKTAASLALPADLPLSVGFFPPQTPEGGEQLRATRARLAAIAPEFFSVTYGAGGSTQERTFAIVREIQDEGHAAAPHLSCVGATRESIREILAGFRAQGIRRIVALRGDLPSGMASLGEFRYASDLVAFIRAETGSVAEGGFHLEVAAYPEMHPQATSFEADLAAFVTKARAGADSAITQFFYNPDAYAHFVARVRDAGVEMPIVPGIMPIASYTKLARFADQCGAEIPRWVRRQFEAYGDDAEAVREFGLDVVTDLCRHLIAQGAPGLHFYCLNQADLTLEIVRRLRG